MWSCLRRQNVVNCVHTTPDWIWVISLFCNRMTGLCVTTCRRLCPIVDCEGPESVMFLGKKFLAITKKGLHCVMNESRCKKTHGQRKEKWKDIVVSLFSCCCDIWFMKKERWGWEEKKLLRNLLCFMERGRSSVWWVWKIQWNEKNSSEGEGRGGGERRRKKKNV